jgi:hypothetical protein
VTLAFKNNKGKIMINQSMKHWSKEERESFNQTLDQIADQLGYALKYSIDGSVFQIGTMEELQKTVTFFEEQDAICGCKKATSLVIVPISDLHWSTRRSLVKEKLETKALINRVNQETI